MNNNYNSIESTNNLSIECIDLDLDIYNNIFSYSGRIKDKVLKGKTTFEHFNYLSADLYLALFKEKFVLKPLIDNNKSIEYGLISNITELDLFKSLKNQCTLSYFNSILATELLGDEILSELKRIAKSETKIPENLNYLNMSPTDFIKLLSEKHLFYTCVNRATAEFNRITHTIKTWGLDDGTLTPTSYEDKVTVALKLRTIKKVRDIAEMAGRFKASASKLQRRRTKEEGIEISGVELGSEIHKTLPSEKMFLAHPSTKRNFFKKLSQRELMSYKYKNSRAKSKGPIICCIDTSASMTGELEVWSKAVALTLLDIAYKQRRSFVAIMYSNKVYKVIKFNKKRREPNKIFDLATFFYGSGTNFVEPLRVSLELISTAKYKYADIVFITDGEALIDDDFIESFLKIKLKKDFRMITINVSDQVEKALDKVNDVQLLLKNLTEDEINQANNIVFSL